MTSSGPTAITSSIIRTSTVFPKKFDTRPLTPFFSSQFQLLRMSAQVEISYLFEHQGACFVLYTTCMCPLICMWLRGMTTQRDVLVYFHPVLMCHRCSVRTTRTCVYLLLLCASTMHLSSRVRMAH